MHITKNIMPYGNVQRAVRSCIGFVFAVFFVLCARGVFSASPASAATLSMATARTTYATGDAIVARVYVGSAGQAVNAFQGTVTLPAMVDFSSISVDGSIASFWVQQPSYSGINNAISFSGVAMNPGFIGDRGLLLTIYGRAKNVGSGSFVISNGSVLANDGQGTEILTSVANAAVTVESSEITPPPSPAPFSAPVISSATNPDQDAWYDNSTVVFSWPRVPGITAVRLVYDQNKATLPAVVYQPPIWTKTITSTSDGTWYFHVQEKTSAGWGAIGTYQVNIDTVSPRAFSIIFSDGSESDNPQPKVSFGTTDALSGVDHYVLAVDDRVVATVPASLSGALITYPLPLQSPGQKTLTVTAFDAARNHTQAVASFTVDPIAGPVIDSYPVQSVAGDPVVIRGHAASQESIVLTLTKQGGDVATQSVSTTADGTFVMAWPTTLGSGVYSLSAYAVDNRGAQSNPTAPVSMIVSQQAWLSILTSFLTYGSLAIVIILFLIGAAFVILYLLSRLRRLQSEVTTEKKKTEETLHEMLIRLAAHVRNHIDILETTKSKRLLSDEEDALVKDLRKDIQDIEKKIGKTLNASDERGAGDE